MRRMPRLTIQAGTTLTKYRTASCTKSWKTRSSVESACLSCESPWSVTTVGSFSARGASSGGRRIVRISVQEVSESGHALIFCKSSFTYSKWLASHVESLCCSPWSTSTKNGVERTNVRISSAKPSWSTAAARSLSFRTPRQSRCAMTSAMRCSDCSKPWNLTLMRLKQMEEPNQDSHTDQLGQKRSSKWRFFLSKKATSLIGSRRTLPK